ncbi:MAG: quinolinate synthase NadA [Paludibacteraceae bacterium]|nr:quinolinate synthase NadA [Paludibacteraceae bacterium]
MNDAWIKKGFVDEPIPSDIDLKTEIRRLCKEKNAVILAHYYTQNEVQDVADYLGDSLALARQAAETTADIIVMCGVHFMGETNKLLSPQKKVLIPDLNAGCSLADSCKASDLEAFKRLHPDHKVISYVNTTAAVKALSDMVVTSGNAKKIVDSFPKDEKLIFGPDKNLGNYINSVTGRNMLLWDGGCHVHGRFSVEAILQLKKEHPDAIVLAHPECKAPILALADVVGSTAHLLKNVIESDKTEFIVATEAGILHEMKKKCPLKIFYPVPPEVSEGTIGCHCNDCEFMKLNTLPKIYNTLLFEWPEINIDPSLAQKAVLPIQNMLRLS